MFGSSVTAIRDSMHLDGQFGMSCSHLRALDDNALELLDKECSKYSWLIDFRFRI